MKKVKYTPDFENQQMEIEVLEDGKLNYLILSFEMIEIVAASKFLILESKVEVNVK